MMIASEILLNSLKIIMYSAADTVSLQTKIYISVATIVDVVLVQHVVQAFIQVF